MNCRQAQDFLPLYAGRDLDEKRAGLIAEHLQSCTACARVADEYREAFQLTQQLAPPVFAEGVYAGIRQRVLRQIEAEAAAPALPQLVVSWFQPRFAWAVAAVLLIAVSASAIYFIALRGDGKEGAGGQVVVGAPETNHALAPAPPKDVSSPADTGEKQRVAGVLPPSRKRLLNTSSNRANDFVAVSSNAVSAGVSPATDSPPATTALPPRETGTSETPLRVEIQTTDPNIRIIWFTQHEIKPAVPASKGT